MSPDSLVALYTLLLQCTDLKNRFSPEQPTSLEVWNFEPNDGNDQLVLNKMGKEKQLISEEKVQIDGVSEVKIRMFEYGDDVVWGGTSTIGDDNYFTSMTGLVTKTRQFADSAIFLLWNHEKVLQLPCSGNVTEFLSLTGDRFVIIKQDFLKCKDSIAIQDNQKRILYKRGSDCKVLDISDPIKWKSTDRKCDDPDESKFGLDAESHTTFYSLTYLKLATTCQIDTNGIDPESTHVKFFHSAADVVAVSTNEVSPIIADWMIYALGGLIVLLLLIVVLVAVLVKTRKYCSQKNSPPKPTLLKKSSFSSVTPADSAESPPVKGSPDKTPGSAEAPKGSSEQKKVDKNKIKKQKKEEKVNSKSEEKVRVKTVKPKSVKEKPEDPKTKVKAQEMEIKPKSVEKERLTVDNTIVLNEETSRDVASQVTRRHGPSMKLRENATTQERLEFLAMSARVDKIMNEELTKPRLITTMEGNKYKIKSWCHLPRAYTGTLIFECINVEDLMDTKCLKVYEVKTHRDRELNILMLDSNDETKRVFPRLVQKVDFGDIGFGILMEMLGEKTSYSFRRIQKEGNFQGGFMYMKHMSEALERLHALGLVHNNVKPNHFVFDLKMEKFMMVDPRFALNLRKPDPRRRIEHYDMKNLEFVSRRAMNRLPTQIIDDYESICLIFVAMMLKLTFAEKGDVYASKKKKDAFLRGGYATKLKGKGLIKLFEFMEQDPEKIREGTVQDFTPERFRQHLQTAALEHNVDLGDPANYESGVLKDEEPGYGEDETATSVEYDQMVNMVEPKQNQQKPESE